jgi:hypothetical protein
MRPLEIRLNGSSRFMNKLTGKSEQGGKYYSFEVSGDGCFL